MIIVPIVLAAGASSRMGRPKALLDFDGKSCIDLVLEACAGAGTARPIVVVAPGAGALRAKIFASGIDATVAQNDAPERGQTSSLRVGLAALPPDAGAFLVYPVDYALVRAADVTALCAAFAARPDVPLVIPSWARRRGHPVLMARALRDEILALPDGSPARTVVDAHAFRILYIEATSDRVTQDMDTPDDYKRCLDRFRAEG